MMTNLSPSDNSLVKIGVFSLTLRLVVHVVFIGNPNVNKNPACKETNLIWLVK